MTKTTSKSWIALIGFSALVCFLANTPAKAASSEPLSQQVSQRSWTILNEIINDFDARPAGSDQETDAINHFAKKMWGAYSSQPVTFNIKDKSLESRNAWITLPGNSDKHIIIGAHADSTGQETGSQGATDNGAALALLLVLGEMLQHQQLNYTVTFVLFGAEEVGLRGSKAFVKALQQDREFISKASPPAAMLNLDTIVGGDYLYIHSPTKTIYEHCDNEATYNSSPLLRDALLNIADKANLPFQLHPDYPGYPLGETGGWSDHAGFACAGIPVAYIEATNFTINGHDGYDGYSQALHPKLWDCLDLQNKTSCDRENEQDWGRIWHTSADRLDTLEELYPGRLQTQLTAVSELLVRYLVQEKPVKSPEATE